MKKNNGSLVDKSIILMNAYSDDNIYAKISWHADKLCTAGLGAIFDEINITSRAANRRKGFLSLKSVYLNKKSIEFENYEF